MSYTWSKDFETGVEAVDRQHQQLVMTLNQLIEACQKGSGVEELERTLEFLVGYTIKHFADEEALQVRYVYPEYLRHKSYHEAFKKTAASYVERLHKEGPNPDLLVEVYTSIGNWLVDHIKGEDFKMATYVKARL
jgi:hemerythrin